MSGVGLKVSDLLRPVVGGTLPPLWLLLAIPAWGLCGVAKSVCGNVLATRGKVASPEVISSPSPLWQVVTGLGAILVLELVICGLGTFFLHGHC